MRLRTLGGLALEGSSLTRPKPLLLLAFLSLEGPRPRRELAELFYPDAADPRDSLSAAVRRLRKGAPDSVEADGATLRAAVETDAAALLAALDRGDAERALELYEGRFLDGVELPSWGVELEEWLYGTREHLGERLRDALLARAEAEAARGRFGPAAARAERALGLPGAPEPGPEELERLHRLLAAGGSPRADELRAEAEAYGVPLARSAEEARAGLAEGRDPAAEAPPHDLPPELTPFVGRDPERLELAALLAAPERHLVTLVGPGGVGKSRLALRVARDLLAGRQLPGGLWWIPLDAIAAPEGVPARLAAALGVDLDGPDPPADRLARALGTGDALLVFDNFEHVLEAAALVAELLRACPGLTVLATSRERLGLAEEWVVPVEGLATAPPDATLERAGQADAVALFVQRARQARHGFALTPAELPHVLAICDAVQGLPLGLELAAAWVRALPPAEIAREIRRDLDFLVAATRDAPDRHASLRAAFEHSWRLLSDVERAALRRLAVCRGGFRREAAGAIAGATLPVLASLVDKSLLRVTPTGRYDRHPLLYGFLREKLAEDPEEREEMERRHAQYYVSFFRRRDTAAYAEVLDALEEELENARAAWPRMIADRDVIGINRLRFGFLRYHAARGSVEGDLAMVAQALPVFEEQGGRSAKLHARLLVTMAYWTEQLGRLGEAELLAERAVRLSLEAEPKARTHYTALGTIQLSLGRFEAARQTFEAALAFDRAAGDQMMQANDLSNLALVHIGRGDFALSESLLREAMTIVGDLATEGNLASAYIVESTIELGSLRLLQGELDEAASLLEEGLAGSRRLGLEVFIPKVLLALSQVDRRTGVLEVARARLEEAQACLDRTPVHSLSIDADLERVRLALAAGDPDAAEAAAAQALRRARASQMAPRLLDAVVALGELRHAQGRGEEAAEALRRVAIDPRAWAWVRERAQELLAAAGEAATEAPATGGDGEIGDLSLDLDALVDRVLATAPRPAGAAAPAADA